MRKLLLLITTLIIFYGCANKQQQAAASEELKQNKQDMKQIASELSKALVQYGFIEGESAVFRKCLNPKGCDEYSLLIITGVKGTEKNPETTYIYSPIAYNEIAKSKVRVIKNAKFVNSYLVLEDEQLMKLNYNSWTTNLDGVTQGGVERCQYVTLKEIDDLEKMVGKTLWVVNPVIIGDLRVSPAHALKVVDISTDMNESYSEDYSYVVKIDNKDTVKIPVRTAFLSNNPIKQDNYKPHQLGRKIPPSSQSFVSF